ncbi:MAG: hypothetical protein KAS66_04115 [Candidatus Omnitrophica bacterium]|nr:hypothetical protein [Candidatus Omnitrophota bacterium]
MNRRTTDKVFNRALTKIENDIPLTTIESKVWTEIIKNNYIPHILEDKIHGMEELLASYISESEKMGPSCVPDDEDIVYGEEIRTLKAKLLVLRSSYESMKGQRKYRQYPFQVM